MTQCSPSELPAIAKMQKKKHKTQEEMDPSGEDVTDRLYVLAALKDAWTAVSLSSAKSMVLITDGGDVAGQSITLCYGFVPGIGRGFLLPHQVPSSCALCICDGFAFLLVLFFALPKVKLSILVCLQCWPKVWPKVEASGSV